METPLGAGDVRQYRLTDVELEWWKLPTLNVADRDRPFTKKAYIDLDPAGGFWASLEIGIQSPKTLYVVIEDIDIEPADAFSAQNLAVRQRFDFDILNRWRQIDQTISPGPIWEKEQWTDRLFVIPSGRTWACNFTNVSPLGRVRVQAKVKGWIARQIN